MNHVEVDRHVCSAVAESVLGPCNLGVLPSGQLVLEHTGMLDSLKLNRSLFIHDLLSQEQETERALSSGLVDHVTPSSPTGVGSLTLSAPLQKGRGWAVF